MHAHTHTSFLVSCVSEDRCVAFTSQLRAELPGSVDVSANHNVQDVNKSTSSQDA